MASETSRFSDDPVLVGSAEARPILMVVDLLEARRIAADDAEAVRFMVAKHLLDHEPATLLRMDIEARGMGDLLDVSGQGR